MRFSEILEAVVIPANDSKQQPKALSDSDTVRVYHGADNIETVILALTKGLTGDTRIYRKYSYENENNPKGLFVTPDLKTAEQFGDYVLEFHARVADLEAPVWPGNGFTAQGQMAQYFGSDENRELARQKAKAEASADNRDFVKNSSKPEVAQLFLTGGERQALFTGNLNANSVRAVWIRSDMRNAYSPFERMSPSKFLKMYAQQGVPTRHRTLAKPADKKSDFYKSHRDKLVNPRDTVSADQLTDLVLAKYPHLNKDEIVDILKNNPDYIDKFLWSDAQKNLVKSQLGSLG